MRAIVVLCVVVTGILALLPACQGEESTPPEIVVDVNPVYVGIRSITADEPIGFDLQIYNRGSETLKLNMLEVRGDQNCAFTFQGPDIEQLVKDQSAFVRGWYKPTVVAVDQIALYIRSNAPRSPLIVPVCGRGVLDGTTDAVEPPKCVIPPDSQPDCP